MTLKDNLYAQADAYIGPGVPFFFCGRRGILLIGFAEVEGLRAARPILDGILMTRGLSATRLSAFETNGGAFGYIAHS